MNKARQRLVLQRLCGRTSQSLQDQPPRSLPLGNGRKGLTPEIQAMRAADSAHQPS
jgi:hypothetical protein